MMVVVVLEMWGRGEERFVESDLKAILGEHAEFDIDI
jgi:hypothetical protein